MFRRIADFRNGFGHERDAVLRLLAAIPEEARDQAVAEGHRTLRRLAFHLVESLIEMPARTGLKVPHGDLFLQHQALPLPETMAEIRQAYAEAADGLLKALDAWTDADLEVEDDMYGQKWARGTTLSILMTHDAYHLGQMTVLMRQAGLKVPGVFGPSKEEWSQYGMPEPAI